MPTSLPPIEPKSSANSHATPASVPPSDTTSSYPKHRYAKPNPLWLWLPWSLLAMVLAGIVWILTQSNMALFSHRPSPNILIPKGSKEWQPPKADPLPAQSNKDLDKAEPIASYHNAVTAAAQSVVNIYTTQKVTSHPYMDDPILRRYYEFQGGNLQESEDSTSLGSGVIVSQDGYIVTNAHVINQADSIVVGLSDGRKVNAKVVGVDSDSDLAVIKVALTGLKPLGFREQSINVGDVVLAIGNPFGVGQTVTQGIISATGRSGLGINTFEDFIQTDAAINPGNSGGALVDAYGQLVGINTAIFSRSGGSMGIGFAIPTSSVEQVMNAIIKTGKVSRGWLGIEVEGKIQDPTKLNEATQGVTVMNVLPNSPAAQAGIQRGDVIVSLDSQPMNDANSLIQYVAGKPPNTTLTAKVQRGKNAISVPITLSERQTLTTLQKMNAHPQRQNDIPSTPNQAPPQIPKELLELLNR